MAERHPDESEFDLDDAAVDVADYLAPRSKRWRAPSLLRERRIIRLKGKLQRCVQLLDRTRLRACAK